VGVLIGASGVALAGSKGLFSSDPDRAQVEGIVRDYILAHPEILPEAMERLQQRESAKLVGQHRESLETPFGSAWAGAEDADVVLVEFFDYACSFCRASNPEVERLLKEDSKLKVVWRELPVLGQDSVAAAHASLAAKQGRFREFFHRLYAAGRPTPAAVAGAMQAAGVQPFRSPEFEAELSKNMELANALRASGTPTFVIGDKVLHGAVGYEALKDAVDSARASKS
jgi:protein-disulfide isomerase